jgi:hypothetical protein
MSPKRNRFPRYRKIRKQNEKNGFVNIANHEEMRRVKKDKK